MAYVHRMWMRIRPRLGHASMSVYPCWTRYDNSHVWNVHYGSVHCIWSFARETLVRRYMVRQTTWRMVLGSEITWAESCLCHTTSLHNNYFHAISRNDRHSPSTHVPKKTRKSIRRQNYHIITRSHVGRHLVSCHSFTSIGHLFGVPRWESRRPVMRHMCFTLYIWSVHLYMDRPHVHHREDRDLWREDRYIKRAIFFRETLFYRRDEEFPLTRN